MAIDTEKYTAHSERDARHSALVEFSRDERRPAVLLLSALMLSVLFFGIGLTVGRWTAEPDSAREIVASTSMGSTSTRAPTPATAPTSVASTSTDSSPDVPRPYSLLVATYDTDEKAQSLIEILEDSGYPEVRSSNPRAGGPRAKYSVLVGRFTQDEAQTTLKRMRAVNHPRMKNAKVIEAGGN